MKAIDKIQLKERLLEEGYIEMNGLDYTINNLVNLTGKASELLQKWLETGRVDKFEPIEGIDKCYLKDTLKMKDPAIILAYGMLLKDPKRNSMILKREAERRNVFKMQNKNQNN